MCLKSGMWSKRATKPGGGTQNVRRTVLYDPNSLSSTKVDSEKYVPQK